MEYEEQYCFATSSDSVLEPFQFRVRVWEAVIATISFLSCILNAFQASFSTEYVAIWILVYIFDIFIILDIVFICYLAYFNESGVLITDRRKILKRYFHGMFVVDVFSILPLEAFVLFANYQTKLLKTAAYWRLNRLIQFSKTMSFMSKHMQFCYTVKSVSNHDWLVFRFKRGRTG